MIVRDFGEARDVPGQVGLSADEFRPMVLPTRDEERVRVDGLLRTL